jgi:heme-degrading monooxygenase HmoA
MFARVNTLEGTPDRVDDGIRDVRERVIPAVEQMQGYRGFLLMVDRSTGKAIGVTFWESEDAMRASEEEAEQVRKPSAAAGGGEVVNVERYEIVHHDVRG